MFFDHEYIIYFQRPSGSQPDTFRKTLKQPRRKDNGCPGILSTKVMTPQSIFVRINTDFQSKKSFRSTKLKMYAAYILIRKLKLRACINLLLYFNIKNLRYFSSKKSMCRCLSTFN